MEPELERLLRERSRELEDANEMLRQSQQMLTAELGTARRLQHLATQLIKTNGIEALYGQILDTGMAILHSDFASIQMFYPERGTNGELRLLGHRGFTAEAAKRWEWVRTDTRTTCGEALRTGRRVAVPDVRNCDFMAGSEDLDGYLGAEIHAGLSMPLISRSDVLLGMVSVYWRDPHEPSVTELRALDVLARMAADLIERSRAEGKLRESEERFRNMADTAPVMIWVAGPDMLWTFVNKRCLDFTGSTLAKKIGYGWIEDIHPEDREQFLAKYSSAFHARQEFQAEIRAHRADGEYVWTLTTGTPRFELDGRFVGYIGCCFDLTEVKRAQEVASAHQTLESVGTLATGIAHDFNNLLGAVLAHAELAQAELTVGLNPQEELVMIRQSATRGSEIVRQLMMYAGKESAVAEPIDISRIIEEIIELLKISISKHAILETDLVKGLPAIQANAAQLRQVVMNLVTNASDAIGDRDGVIRVSTRCVKLGEDRKPISDRSAQGDYVQLEVFDTGHGIPVEMQAKVFEPFVSTKSAGRGLGLAIVQGIVRSLGGLIHLASQLGKGTTFQILFPSAPTTPEAFGRHGEQSSRPTAECTILVVEDEEPLRRAVVKMLRRTDFDVLEAADGSAAIDLIRANGCKIDLILLDVTIPGASGHQIVAEAAKARPDIRVVLTSAYSQKMILEGGMNTSQVRDFIRKPFQLGDLVQALRKAMSS